MDAASNDKLFSGNTVTDADCVTKHNADINVDGHINVNGNTGINVNVNCHIDSDSSTYMYPIRRPGSAV
jgi:hypothetical protein